MKKIILTLIVLTAACVQAATLSQYSIQKQSIPEHITITASVSPVRLPLVFIKDSKISMNQSLDINLVGKRGISINNHTKQQWVNEWLGEQVNNNVINMNQIPEIIFKSTFKRIKNNEFRKQLLSIRKIILHKDITISGFIRQGDVMIYIAISHDKGMSTILLSSKKYPDMFTQISIFGLTKSEIDKNIIQGFL